MKTKPKYFDNLFIHIIVIICVIFGVYFSSLSLGFVHCDDHDLLLKDGAPITNVKGIEDIFLTGYCNANYYRPIINLSLWLDYQIVKESTFIFHFSNLLFHIIFSIGLYIFLKKLNLSPLQALTGTLFYCIHPLFTNSVAWIVGRNDILCGIFCIYSFICFINYLNSKRKTYFAAHILLLLLAFLTKETAFVFPAILVAYLFFIKNERNLLVIFKKYLLFWLIPFAVYFILYFNSELGNEVNRYGFDVILMNLRVFPELIAKFFVPVKLSVLPTYNTFNTVTGLIIIALASLLLIKIKLKDRNYLYFGLFWFIILVLPGVFITLKNSPEWNEYLETRAYIPMVGFLLILLNIDYKSIIKKNSIYLKLFLGLVFILFGVKTIDNIGNYKNPLSFYKNAVENDPERPMFHLMLTQYYHDIKDYKQAEEHVSKAVKLCPNVFLYNFKAGSYYLNAGAYSSAIQYFEAAKKLDPESKATVFNLGKAYIGAKRIQDMVSLWEAAVLKWPDYYPVIDHLANAYLMIDEYDKADSTVAKLINKYSTDRLSISYFNKAEKKYQTKDYQTALRLYRKAVELDSNNYQAKNAIKKLNEG